MNFLIMNQHTLNFGDDIAGISLIKQILRFFPDKSTKINIVYNTPGALEIDDSRVFNRKDISLKKIGAFQLFIFLLFSLIGIKIVYNEGLKKFRNIVNDSDVILVSPGGANLGMYKDWRYLIKLYITTVFGGKPIFHYNTIEFSDNFVFNFFEKKVLKNSKIYVREEKSFIDLSQKGYFPERGVDTAFSFENNTDFHSFDGKEYLAFIPTNLDKWHPDFKNDPLSTLSKDKIIQEIVGLAKKKNFSIVIVQHMHGAASEKKLYDECYERMIESGMDKSRILIPVIEDAYQYDNLIKNSQFVVSMRYHGVVMSIKNGVPFCSLEYENKMFEVCNYSNLQDLNIKLKLIDKNFDLEEFYNKGCELMQSRGILIDKIKKMSSEPLRQLKYEKLNVIEL